MEIVKIKIKDLKPYKNNAKQHPEEQINRIMKSIEEFGMNDPIAVWGKNNVIVEGHGRLEALKKLGYKEVECIRLDHLSDEERKAYTLTHNKLTMDTDFDINILTDELDSIDDIDMSDFGFIETNIDWVNVEELKEENYEEPNKDMLECPNCHHIDSKNHFRKIKSDDDIEKIKVENYKIKNAKLEDIDSIKKIADKYCNEIGFVLRPALEENIKDKTVLIAESENNILGFCNYHKRKDKVSTIYEICIDYKYRGNGIAKAIIDNIPKPIKLKCPIDNESNNFYAKVGFELIDVEDGKKRKLNVWELK